jgi:hypothetical protein
MERKGGTRTVEVESKTVQRDLKNEARVLTTEEDKALRMRHGASVGLNEPLAQVARANTELGDELLLMEMQLLRAFRAKTGKAQPVAAPANSASRTKNKIVNELRKKR